MKHLYCIENNITNKQYIGVTIDLERRWKQHTNPNLKKNSAIHDAIMSYGKENFTLTVLHTDEDSIIDSMEVQYIKDRNTQVPNGYNFTLGGDGASYNVWDDEWNKLLGTRPDREIAELVGFSAGIITSRRRGLNIKSFKESTATDWTEWIQYLGVLTDDALSKKMGVSSSTVGNKRYELGIKASGRVNKRHEYPDELIELLGVIPDTELAERFNIPSSAINTKRRNLGIKKAKLVVGWRKIEWSEEQLNILYDTTILAVDAKDLVGASLSTVHRFRKDNNVGRYTGKDSTGRNNYIPLEGEFLKDMMNELITNKEIADKYGYQLGTINYKRNSKSFLKVKRG